MHYPLHSPSRTDSYTRALAPSFQISHIRHGAVIGLDTKNCIADTLLLLSIILEEPVTRERGSQTNQSGIRAT